MKQVTRAITPEGQLAPTSVDIEYELNGRTDTAHLDHGYGWQGNIELLQRAGRRVIRATGHRGKRSWQLWPRRG